MKKSYVKAWLVTLPIVLIGLLILGTFKDYQIAQSIYNPNNIYSNIFAGIGKMPAFFVGAFAFVILLKCVCNHQNKTVISYMLLGIYFFGGVCMCALGFLDIFEFLFPNEIVWQVIVSGITGLALFNIIVIYSMRIRTQEIERYRKWAVYSLVCVVLFISIVTVLKMLWGRLRYEQIVEGLGEFSPWYIIQRAGGKSFPSGHAIMACGGFLLVPLAKYNHKMQENIFWIRLVSSAFVALTMLARISAGNHFVSDIMISAIVSYIIIMTNNLIFWGKEGNRITFRKESFWNHLC